MTPALLLRFARFAALGGLVALLIAADQRGIAELPGRLMAAVLAPVRGPIDDAPIADLLFGIAGLLALASGALGAVTAASTRAAAVRAMGAPVARRADRATPPDPVRAEPTPPAAPPRTRFAGWRETLMARREEDDR